MGFRITLNPKTTRQLPRNFTKTNPRSFVVWFQQDTHQTSLFELRKYFVTVHLKLLDHVCGEMAFFYQKGKTCAQFLILFIINNNFI